VGIYIIERHLTIIPPITTTAVFHHRNGIIVGLIRIYKVTYSVIRVGVFYGIAWSG